MINKQCYVCNEIKPLDEFYKNKRMKDGHANKCGKCAKKYALESFREKMKDPIFAEKEKIRSKNRAKSRSRMENMYEYQKVYSERYPEKYKAKFATKKMQRINGGELHHWSYNKEHYRDIIELEKNDHKKAHRFLVYDQERFMYRRFDTNELLDTRESHLEFIMWCIENR